MRLQVTRKRVNDRSRPTRCGFVFCTCFIVFTVGSWTNPYSHASHNEPIALVRHCPDQLQADDSSEQQETEIQREVNEMVWRPFKAAYENRDWESFNDLHTDQILRVNDRGIRIGREYKEDNKDRFQRPDDRKLTIDFAFERRLHRDDTGYEVGFYRVVYERPGERPEVHFGRFHVVLRKVNGSWKIAQDWDSSTFNGEPITNEDFHKATLLELPE